MCANFLVGSEVAYLFATIIASSLVRIICPRKGLIELAEMNLVLITILYTRD